MKINILYIFLTATVLFASCKEKDLPPNIVKENPIFEVKGQADGRDFHLIGGDDAYFMHTSYSYDSDKSIYTFVGELKANVAQPKLAIYIQDTKQRTSSAGIDMSEVLQNGAHAFRTLQGEVLGYVVDFKQEDAGPVATQSTWTFGDGSQSLLASPSRRYRLDSSRYSIKLVTEQPDGCRSELQQFVYPAAADCRTDFKFSGNIGLNPDVQFQITTNIPSSYRFRWSFGDGNSTVGQQANHKYLGIGVYPVCLEVNRNNVSCQQSICKNVMVGNIQACPANFSYTSTPIMSFDTLGLSQLTIVWTDASGTAWRSDTHNQPAQSEFTITKNESYKANSQGDPTAKFHFGSFCRLWSENDSIDFGINRGVFGVAYPK